MMNTIYAGVRKQHLVVDNLNRHFASSFEAVLVAEVAGPILARLDFHHMPKHARWLRNLCVAVLTLAANAASAGVYFQHLSDADALWNIAERQAAGVSAIPVMDSAVDSAVPAPGLALALSRRCSSYVPARRYTGWFGRGWYTPWQARLLTGNPGVLVTLVGEGNSMRLFTFDTRTGGYFSPAGDNSTLVALGRGVYELRDPSGGAVRFRNDGSGKVDYVQDPNGNRVSATYDDNGRLITLSHSAGGFISIAYNRDGLVQSVTNSAGRFVTYAYDGNLLQTVTTDDGKVTSYAYETGILRELHSVTRGGVTRQFTYDDHFRVASTSLAAGEQLLEFGYDGAGGLSITDGQGTAWLYFDDRGLLAKILDPLGNITTAEYDNDLRLSRRVFPTGESQSYSWCGCGSPTSLTDELGHTTRFSYDHPLKRLTSLTDAAGNTSRYTYDAQGNGLSAVYPDGSVGYVGNYSPSGLAQSSTDRRGQPISYAYSSNGQLARRTFADGSFAQFDYDARGNLTNVTEHPNPQDNKITTFTYDYATSGNRLRKVTYPNNRWVEFFYDSFGRRQRMADSTGQDLRYDYDVAGRLWRLRDAAGAVLAEYLYNGAGWLRRLNKGNGTYTTYDYDAAGRLLHLTNSAPDGSVNSRFGYTHDQRGRRTAVSTLDGDWTYAYDAPGQLIHAAFASRNLAIPNQDLQFNYDAAGNRTSTVSNGVTSVYLANKLNLYTSVGGITCQYDPDGNLTFDGVRTYEYDVQSRLTRVTGPEGDTAYEYDAFGNRTAAVVNGQRTEYLLDPLGLGSVIAEFDSHGLTARYVQGLGLVARTPASNPAAFYDFDALGSAVGISDGTGAYVNRYAYSPFGSALFSSGSLANSFQFCGLFGVMQETDGLQFMRARYYSPALGRFTSPDPIGLGGRDANFLRYANNNPASLRDPSGLTPDFRQVCGYINQFLNEWGDVHTAYKMAKNMREWDNSRLSTDEDLAAAEHWLLGADTTAKWGKFGGLAALGGPIVAFYYDLYKEYNWLFNVEDPTDSAPGFEQWWWGSVGYQMYNPCGPNPNPDGTYSPDPDHHGGRLGGAGEAKLHGSRDPNQKLGPNGIGAGHHVLPGAVLPYRIDFENEAGASAPAQEVVVTDQLSPNLDLATFQLTDLGFGDQMIFVPPNQQHYETTVTMTCCGDIFQVQVEAGLRLDSGQVYAIFRSIDPVTSLPPSVQYGFLPPEDGTGRGQGHLSYLVQARTNLPSGTQIRNTALIVFDRQNSIATNQRDPHNPAAGTDPAKEALNTIDAGSPSSAVAPLPAQSGRSFIVQWSGQDDIGGSGIATYDIYVSTNGSPFGLWLAGTRDSSALFAGALGQTYAFFSVARDAVGHAEPPPATPDAQTVIVTDSPLLAAVADIATSPGQSLNVTNLVQGAPVGSFLFSLGPGAPPGLAINPTNGRLSWTPDCANGGTTNVLTVWVTDSARTNISDAVRFTISVSPCVRPGFGQQIILAGASGRVPVNLISSLALTNLEITLVTAPDRLTDFTIEPLVPELCTNTVAALGDGQYRLELVTCPGAFLTGTQQLAWLNFTAVTNQSSAFVSLVFTRLTGRQADGNIVADFAPQSGRVVVVGEEPLLECVLTTNSQPSLILYGKSVPGYSLESRTDVASGAWQPVITGLTLTNLSQQLIPPPTSSPANYFRALRSLAL